MAALTTEINLPFIGTPNKSAGVCNAALTFFKGAIVYADATSGKLCRTGAAGTRAMGIITHTQITTAADQVVEYWSSGIFQFPTLSGVTIADQGENIIVDQSVAVTDNPADCLASGDVTLAANDILIGKLLWMNGAPHVDITGRIGGVYDGTAAAWL